MYSTDTWAYLDMAFLHPFVGFAPDRPSGYPMFIELVGVGDHVAPISLVQHVMGLACGVLIYALLLRHGVRRWLALGVTGVLLFDAYTIALEQEILSEAVMGLSITAALFLVASRESGPVAVGLSGVLLAYAATVRTAALFVIPVWAIYLLWAKRDLRTVVIAAVSISLPLAAYLTWHDREAGGFRFIDAQGWFLYARVGPIGNCGEADIPAKAQPLCPLMTNQSRDPSFYLWDLGGSPARRVFPEPGAIDDPDVNSTLRAFATAIVRDRPIIFARMVGRDLVRYFEPGNVAGEDLSMNLQPRPLPPHVAGTPKQEWAQGYREDPRLPRRALDLYAEWVHVPRPLLGVVIAVAGLLLTLGLLMRRRIPLPRRREALLLLGGGVAVFVGATATSAFALRYLIPVLPLLGGGAALVLEDALALRRRRMPTPA